MPPARRCGGDRPAVVRLVGSGSSFARGAPSNSAPSAAGQATTQTGTAVKCASRCGGVPLWHHSPAAASRTRAAGSCRSVDSSVGVRLLNAVARATGKKRAQWACTSFGVALATVCRAANTAMRARTAGWLQRHTGTDTCEIAATIRARLGSPHHLPVCAGAHSAVVVTVRVAVKRVPAAPARA